MTDLTQEEFDEAANYTDLTPEQKRILLVLCDAFEARGDGSRAVRLVTTTGQNPIREPTTAAALVRKGLAWKARDGRYEATSAGYWMTDRLRIDDRQGRIPARRRAVKVGDGWKACE